MKTNIKKNGMWWSWHETCDRCGKLIFDEEWRTTEEPDTDEADFCVDCIRYFFDANIPYEEAKNYLRLRENKGVKK